MNTTPFAGEGLRLLCRLIALSPRTAHFEALHACLEPAAIRSCGPGALRQVVTTLVEYAQRLPVPGDARCIESPNLRIAAEIVAAIRAAHPTVSRLYSSEVFVRRRLDDPRATLHVAERGAQLFPGDWACVAAMVNALRDAKQPDTALEYSERALAIDPKDGSPLHDAGWAFMDVGRGTDAARVFTRLLRLFPEYPGAERALAIANLGK